MSGLEIYGWNASPTYDHNEADDFEVEEPDPDLWRKTRAEDC